MSECTRGNAKERVDACHLGSDSSKYGRSVNGNNQVNNLCRDEDIEQFAIAQSNRLHASRGIGVGNNMHWMHIIQWSMFVFLRQYLRQQCRSFAVFAVGAVVDGRFALQQDLCCYAEYRTA